MVGKLSLSEKDELNKLGNTIEIVGETPELESMFGNKKVTQIRKSLLDKGFIKKIDTDSRGITTIDLSDKGWNWYHAKG